MTISIQINVFNSKVQQRWTTSQGSKWLDKSCLLYLQSEVQAIVESHAEQSHRLGIVCLVYCSDQWLYHNLHRDPQRQNPVLRPAVKSKVNIPSQTCKRDPESRLKAGVVQVMQAGSKSVKQSSSRRKNKKIGEKHSKRTRTRRKIRNE